MGVAESMSVLRSLTEKQIAVLDLISAGFTSKEVALQLGIAPRTVDQRVDAVRVKLGNISRVQLIRLYRENGGICDRPTYDRITIPQAPTCVDEKAHQPTPESLIFEDHIAHDARMPWQTDPRWLSTGLTPADLSGWTKMLLIAFGALIIIAVAILSVSFSSALSSILYPA